MKNEHQFKKDRPHYGMNLGICGLYSITSPDGEIYIGQSREVKRRWMSYFSRRVTDRKIDLSLIRYGAECHKFVLLHELPSDVSNDVLGRYEDFLIKQYTEAGFILLNIRGGGVGGKHSLDSIIKMRGKVDKWMKGRVPSDSVVKKIVETRKRNNKKLSNESIIRYRESKTGSKNSMSKITEDDVLEIINIRNTSKLSYEKIGKKYGLTRSSIANIFNGNTWNYLTKIIKK